MSNCFEGVFDCLDRSCQSPYEQHSIKTDLRSDSKPQSLARGDFNNDSYFDLAVANTLTDTVGIFLGYENGTFGIQMTYPTGDGSIPCSITVGYINNDRRQDIAVANYGTHSIGIFLAQGNGTFDSQKVFSTGASRPRAIAIGDFNADGWNDLVYVNSGTNTISLLLGYGDGSFHLEQTYWTGYDSLPRSIAIGDLNNDNRSDIVVAYSGSQTIGIFYGDGNGTLTNQSTYSTGSGSLPYSISLGDFNGDHQLDIVVANARSDNLGIFLAFQNGTFATQKTYSTGAGSVPVCVFVEDFDNDGRADIAVTNIGASTVAVLLGYNDGTFAKQATFTAGVKSYPISLAVGDFNKDNLLDIATAHQGVNVIVVVMGNRIRLFETQKTYVVKNVRSIRPIFVGDFNNDQRQDLVIPYEGSDVVVLLFGNGKGSFSHTLKLSTGIGTYPSAVAVGDFNRDGQGDIVVGHGRSSSIMLLLGNGNGTFSMSEWFVFGADYPTFSIVTGDLNNDDRPDVVATTGNTEYVAVLLGDGNGAFGNVTNYPVGSGFAELVVLAKFNDDEWLDMAIINYGTTEHSILLGQGNGTFAASIPFSIGDNSGANSFASGDFDEDKRMDLAVVDSTGHTVAILLGNGDGTFQPVTTFGFDHLSSARSIVVDDFNRDYHSDIAVTDIDSNSVFVFLGYGNGTFAKPISHDGKADSSLNAILACDLDNDNQRDIVLANSATDDISVLMGHYRMTYQNSTVYSTGSASQPIFIVIGNLNRDNRTDMVVVNSGTKELEIYLGSDQEIFKHTATYAMSASPRHAVVGDVNNDSHLDIVVAGYLGNSIVIFIGDGNGSFTPSVSQPTGSGSWPSAVAVGHFNGDDWLDIVVANENTGTIGLHLGFELANFDEETTYPLSHGLSPRDVATGDFNKDSYLDIAIANSGDDTVGVLLGSANGTFEIMIVYPTGNNSWPNALILDDFNNDSHLDIASLSHLTSEVAILLGYGNGTFTRPNIYSTGNESIPQSMAVADLNHDTWLDLVIANSATGSVGILFGYGNGTFMAVETYSAGGNSTPNSISLGDVNNDKKIDALVGYLGVDHIGLLFGSDNGTLEPVTFYQTGPDSSPRWAVLADVDNDFQLDIVVSNSGTGDIGILRGFGNGTFDTIETYSTGSNSFPLKIAVRDLNRDNHPDIVVTLVNADIIGVLFGEGNGSFLPIESYWTNGASSADSIAIADLNSDNQLDILVGYSDADMIGILLGKLEKTFIPQRILLEKEGSQPRSIVVADFNGDSQLDMAVAMSGTNSIGILLGTGHGQFNTGPVLSTGNGSVPIFVISNDFNSDTYADIIVTNSRTDDVGVFLGFGNGTFESMITFSTGTGSRPVSIAEGDFNGDMAPDIIVANAGTNEAVILIGNSTGMFIKYTSFAMGYDARPAALTVGDFNNDGSLDIAVANTGTNNIELLMKVCSD